MNNLGFQQNAMSPDQDQTTTEVNECNSGEDSARHSDTAGNGGLPDERLWEEWLVKYAIELSRLEASQHNAKVINVHLILAKPLLMI